MCCSNDTAAATGIFTPHLEISAFFPSPLLFWLSSILSHLFHPSKASIVRVSPSKKQARSDSRSRNPPMHHRPAASRSIHK